MLQAGLKPAQSEDGAVRMEGISSLWAWVGEGSRGHSPYLAALAAAAGDTPEEMGHVRAQVYTFLPRVMFLPDLLTIYHLPTDSSYQPSTPPSSIHLSKSLLLCIWSYGTHKKKIQAGWIGRHNDDPRKSKMSTQSPTGWQRLWGSNSLQTLAFF